MQLQGTLLREKCHLTPSTSTPAFTETFQVFQARAWNRQESVVTLVGVTPKSATLLLTDRKCGGDSICATLWKPISRKEFVIVLQLSRHLRRQQYFMAVSFVRTSFGSHYSHFSNYPDARSRPLGRRRTNRGLTNSFDGSFNARKMAFPCGGASAGAVWSRCTPRLSHTERTRTCGSEDEPVSRSAPPLTRMGEGKRRQSRRTRLRRISGKP